MYCRTSLVMFFFRFVFQYKFLTVCSACYIFLVLIGLNKWLNVLFDLKPLIFKSSLFWQISVYCCFR